jgi:hypothetical protein
VTFRKFLRRTGIENDDPGLFKFLLERLEGDTSVVIILSGRREKFWSQEREAVSAKKIGHKSQSGRKKKNAYALKNGSFQHIK